MQNRSSSSVKIVYYDRQKVLQALREALKRLVKGHPEVQEVVLFGSFVRGDTVPGSDVDLILILKESSEDFLDRIPRYLPTAVPGGVDVFPYTHEELDRMIAEGNHFVRRALAEGKRFSREAVLAGKMAA